MRIFALTLVLFFSISCAEFFGPNNSNKGCTDCAPSLNPFPKGYDPQSGEFSEEKMLASVGLNGILPLVNNLSSATNDLHAQLQNSCDLPAARSQWQNAMAAFHQLAAAPIGPLVEPGRLLVDNIYGWPAFNPCGIDLEVARLARGEEWNPRLLYTMKGLSALEYLLFEPTYISKCNPRSENNKPAIEWNQKSLADKQADRCKMARGLTEDLVSFTSRLKEGWEPQQYNFSKTLMDGSKYKTTKEAVTAMSDALFAIEYIKDVKLGKPLGLHKDCTNPAGVCLEAIENRWSGSSIAAAISQLQGFKQVFTAGTARGFDDYLEIEGHKAVSDRILAAVDQAIVSGLAVQNSGTLEEHIQAILDQNLKTQCKDTTIENRTVPVCAFFQDVRQIAIRMKTEFLSVLSIRAPPTHGGDND